MNTRHIVQLDGLRFFAVLMVMVGHWLQWQWTHPILTKLPLVHGVTLFFVLSGFLITRILLTYRDTYDIEKKNKIVLIKNFYVRRFLRIFPIYYLLLLFLFLIDFQGTRKLFPWLITYTINIYQSIHTVYVGQFNHFWSLAVEEQFYLFWPFVLLFVKPRKTFLIIIFIILLALAVRMYLYLCLGKWMAASFFTLSCMYSLGLGALLAYINIYKPKTEDLLSKPIWLYLAIVFYGCSLLMQHALNIDWYKVIFDDFFFSLVAFFMIVRASRNEFKGVAKMILENRCVVYSGKISYGLYVYHTFIPFMGYAAFGSLGFPIVNLYMFFIVAFLMTYLVSSVSWELIESPINKLKVKFPY